MTAAKLKNINSSHDKSTKRKKIEINSNKMVQRECVRHLILLAVAQSCTYFPIEYTISLKCQNHSKQIRLQSVTFRKIEK